MSDSPTPDKILNTAERLFADHGISVVSLRKVVEAAGVNVAAVNYHFGSKDDLIRAVLRRRICAVTDERLRQIAVLKEKYGVEPIPVRELVFAFLEPAMSLGKNEEGGRDFFRLVARAHAETSPLIQEELFLALRESIQVFLAELKRSIPQLNDRERSMRLAFAAGAMVQAVLLPLKPGFVQEWFSGIGSDEEMLEMLVQFCEGGFSSAGASSS